MLEMKIQILANGRAHLVTQQTPACFSFYLPQRVETQVSTTLLEMHFFSGAQHSFISIRRSPKTSDSWFVCFWKISFFPGLFSVTSRQKVVSCLQEISKGQKLCYVPLEGFWHHSCTMYRWLIVHHVLQICFSMALMSRARGSVPPV